MSQSLMAKNRFINLEENKQFKDKKKIYIKILQRDWPMNNFCLKKTYSDINKNKTFFVQ